jgi:hypothetical protein
MRKENIKRQPADFRKFAENCLNYEVKLKKFSLPTSENHASSASRHHAAGASRANARSRLTSPARPSRLYRLTVANHCRLKVIGAFAPGCLSSHSNLATSASASFTGAFDPFLWYAAAIQSTVSASISRSSVRILRGRPTRSRGFRLPSSKSAMTPARKQAANFCNVSVAVPAARQP